MSSVSISLGPSSSRQPTRTGGWSALRGATYLLALTAWWNVCGYYFGPAFVAVEQSAPTQVERQQQGPAARGRQLNPLHGGPSATVGAAVRTAATAPKATASVDKGTGASASVASTGAAGVSAAGVSASSAASGATAGAAGGAADVACPNRRPYHTILTGQGTFYNGWQARIMYFHWKKQSAAGGPCTDMTGFTRLCASKDGLPDGLEDYIPSVFVPQLTTEVLAKYGHFGVLNRPHSVVEFFKRPEMRARIKEEYVYIAETDHVLMRPLPNLATPTEAAAHAFGYMHASSAHQRVVEMTWKGGDWKQLQPVRPARHPRRTPHAILAPHAERRTSSAKRHKRHAAR